MGQAKHFSTLKKKIFPKYTPGDMRILSKKYCQLFQKYTNTPESLPLQTTLGRRAIGCSAPSYRKKSAFAI